MSRRFAEIDSATHVVSLVFDHEPEWDPEYPPNTVYAVNVTEVDPEPLPGWIHDPVTGEFTAPPEEEAPPPPEEV